MSSSPRETFRLGPLSTPRIWVGLWQLSSNAWGSASVAKIRQGMARHAALGYTAFGKPFFHISSAEMWLIFTRHGTSFLYFTLRLCSSICQGKFLACHLLTQH